EAPWRRCGGPSGGRAARTRTTRGGDRLKSTVQGSSMANPSEMQQRAQEFRTAYGKVHREIGKVVVGHSDIVHGILTCLFTGGHALLEGVPGLGKTLLVRTLSQVLELQFNRIQFTPDLMPSDIIGTNIINEDASGQRVFSFQSGP